VTSDRPTLTPEQARRQLTDIQTRSLHSPRDRRIHAIGTAIFGLTSGFYMAAQNAITGAGHIVLSCVVVAIWVGEGFWVERAARTVPRRARLWSRLGIGGSLALALGLVLPWLNLRAQTSPNTWPMVLAGAFVVAVPSLVAAAVIARGRR
jgi:hypothetical protein